MFRTLLKPDWIEFARFFVLLFSAYHFNSLVAVGLWFYLVLPLKMKLEYPRKLFKPNLLTNERPDVSVQCPIMAR